MQQIIYVCDRLNFPSEVVMEAFDEIFFKKQRAKGYTGTENSTGNTTVITDTSLMFDVKKSQQHPALWTFFVVLETIMLVGTFYIFTSLLYHMFTKQKKNTRAAGSLRKKRFLKAVLLICLTAYAAIGLAKVSVAQAIAYSSPSATLCAAFAKANRVLHISSFVVLSLFLWFRQYILYNMPQFRHLTLPLVAWWSRVTLFFIAVAAVAGITITLKKQWQHNNACVTGDTGVSKSATAGVVASIIVQGSLLALFSLLIVKRWYWKSDLPSVANAASHKRNQRLVRKCCVLAAVCTFIDISCLIVVTLIKSKVPEQITILILDFEEFIDMFCLGLCLANWQEMLLPWPCCKVCLSPDRVLTISCSADSTSRSRVATVTQSIGSTQSQSSRKTKKTTTQTSKDWMPRS